MQCPESHLTIAIITRRRQDKLKRCLDSILKQSELPEAVLVVDNDKERTSWEVCSPYLEKLPISYVVEEEQGAPFARNAALDHCHTECIGFVDDDCVLDKNWVLAGKEALKKDEISFVVGKSLLLNPGSLVAQAKYYTYTNWFFKRIDPETDRIAPNTLDTKNVILRRKHLDDHDIRFDTSFWIPPVPAGEDVDLGLQLERAGLFGYYASEMIVQHEEQESLTLSLKNHYHRGRLSYLIGQKWNQEGRVLYYQGMKERYRRYFLVYLVLNIVTDMFRNSISEWMVMIVVRMHQRAHMLGYFKQKDTASQDTLSLERKGMFTKTVQDNMVLNAREFREHSTVLASYPIKIYLEPTQRCNLNCVMCSYRRRQCKEDMEMELFRKIERELFSHVAEVNFFLTGEPTLARHFLEMIETCSKYSFLPKVFTNGNHLSDEIAEELVRQGFFVNVSFDSTDKERFESIRRGAKFENVFANIEKLQRINKRLKNDRFHIRLASTLGMDNIDEAQKLVEMARSLDITEVMFGCCDCDGKTMLGGGLYEDPKTSVSHLLAAKRYADENHIRFSCPKKIGKHVIGNHHNWNDFDLPIDRHSSRELESFNPEKGDCGYPWIQTAIRCDGTVVSCCQREHILGNFKEDTFETIWNNKSYQKLRKQVVFYWCFGQKCNMAEYSIWNGGSEREPKITRMQSVHRGLFKAKRLCKDIVSFPVKWTIRNG